MEAQALRAVDWNIPELVMQTLQAVDWDVPELATQTLQVTDRKTAEVPAKEIERALRMGNLGSPKLFLLSV